MIPPPRRLTRGAAILATGLAALSAPASAASPRPIALSLTTLDLPAAPAAIVPADLNADGTRDLLIVTAHSSWGSISNDRIEDAVFVTEVVSALLDNRDARAFLAQPGGGYKESGAPLDLPDTVHTIETGPPALPVVALTDDGVSVMRWRGDGETPGLVLEPVLQRPCALARTGTLLNDLDVVRDVDGDGILDLIFPGEAGLEIFHGADGGFEAQPVSSPVIPGSGSISGDFGVRFVQIPDIEDVTGDGTLDLVVRSLGANGVAASVLRGLGGGRFADAVRIGSRCLETKPQARPAQQGNTPQGGKKGDPPVEESRQIGWFGDLDGDGRAEVVTLQEQEQRGSEFKDAKEPLVRYRLYHLKPDLSIDPAPYRTFDAKGHAGGGAPLGDDSAFLDLDGDHRKELITITLDFSMLQALRVLTTKKISIGLEFHVYSQGADGSFTAVTGQTLDEKLRLDLNDLQISRLGQFQGDFDGDKRVDFVHLGRGKTVTIHRGQQGGRYPDNPDLSIELAQEVQDVMLVKIEDFDGDGRSDLAITRMLPQPEAGVSAPARVELRLSGAKP